MAYMDAWGGSTALEEVDLGMVMRDGPCLEMWWKDCWEVEAMVGWSEVFTVVVVPGLALAVVIPEIPGKCLMVGSIGDDAQ